MHADAHLSRCLHTSSVADRNVCPASAAGAAAQQLLQSSASSACMLLVGQCRGRRIRSRPSRGQHTCIIDVLCEDVAV